MRNLILVCESHKAKQPNVGCCGEKMPEKVIEKCRNLLTEKGLEMEVRAVPCLNNCKQGISIKVFPANILYGNIGENEIEEIVNQHIIAGNIVEKLRIRPVSFLD
jgi:(2Fe-2S) ferredoxin